MTPISLRSNSIKATRSSSAKSPARIASAPGTPDSNGASKPAKGDPAKFAAARPNASIIGGGSNAVLSEVLDTISKFEKDKKLGDRTKLAERAANSGANFVDAAQRITGSGTKGGKLGSLTGSFSPKLGVAAFGVQAYQTYDKISKGEALSASDFSSLGGTGLTALAGVYQTRAKKIGEKVALAEISKLPYLRGKRANLAKLRAAAPEFARAATQVTSTGRLKSGNFPTAKSALRSVGKRAGIDMTIKTGKRVMSTAMIKSANAPVKIAGLTLGKVGGRIIPGLNVGIAAADTVQAGEETYKTFKFISGRKEKIQKGLAIINAKYKDNPALNAQMQKAYLQKQYLAVNQSIQHAQLNLLVAGFSCAGATNIPIVSQISGGLSAGVAFARDAFSTQPDAETLDFK